ncbi:MAG: hypothetical protein IJH65_12065 [Methanobrevibacter sp.]|nr:hypothetical protein [Methanobrevibacter sp.]
MNSPITLIAEDESLALYRVKSSSDPDLTYGVDIDKREGTVFCDCPDFIYRRQTEKWGGSQLVDVEHHCKHVTQVLSYRLHEKLLKSDKEAAADGC